MLVKNINMKIQEALKARERALSRTEGTNPTEAEQSKDLPNLSDISSRTTFVRMVSNKATATGTVVVMQGGFMRIPPNEGTAGPPEKIVRSTSFGFENVYEEKSDDQIRPLSGIKDISVEYQGGYSAIRKATVNWRASSLDDLELFAPHFLNVGNTLLLDWGWIYKRKELNNYATFYNEGVLDQTVFSNPMPKIFNSNGSYDAIGGLISNFEYTLTEDGGFDCVTYITSIGINLFNSTRVDKGSGDFVPTVDENGKSTEIYSDDLISAIINLPTIVAQEIKANKEVIHKHQSTTPEDGNIGMDARRLVGTKDKQLYFCQISGRLLDKDKDHENTYSRNDFFVRWGWLEDNIFSRYSSYINANNEILSAIRSIETEIDANGNPIDGDFRSVLIRNNPYYLMPRDPMKFFLPGQNINPISIQSLKQAVNKGWFFTSTKITGVGLESKSREVFESLLKLNGESDTQFADPNNMNYGRIRNIMVNVKEIQKAFGIKPDKIVAKYLDSEQSPAKIYGTDVVTNPPADIKSGIKRLLSALNQNFYGFWNFDITQDPFNFNIKIIDTHGTAGLTEKAYTTFSENSNKVSSNGMYKFPSYTLGSMVKSQNLSFKIPDSMAVTAAYGSNKNKAGGIRVDTTNTYPELETFFESEADSPDQRMKGLDKAFRSGTSGHSVGNKSGDPDSPITKDGSFQINPNASWWSKWTEKKNSEVEKPKEDPTDAEIVERNRLDDFSSQLHLIIGVGSEAVNAKNKDIQKQIDQLKKENDTLAIKADADLPSYSGDEGATKKFQDQLKELSDQIIQPKITNQYYTFVSDSENQFRIELFPAGEAVLRAKLFNFDEKSNLYQTNWLIPAELTLEVDGIGGITPGDILQTDYILPRYNEQLKEKDSGAILGPRTFFQTFGLTQKIDDTGWTTEITTKMRMNNSVLEKKSIEVFYPKFPETKEIKVEDVDESIVVPTKYGCMDDSLGFNPDIYGEQRDPGIEEGNITYRGYKALNYDPQATIQQVSEEDMSNPCTYLEENEDEEQFEPDDLQYDNETDKEPERQIQALPIPGCVDQMAENYVYRDEQYPDYKARMNHPETGELMTLEELNNKGIIRVIKSDTVPCIYDTPPQQTESQPPSQETEDTNLLNNDPNSRTNSSSDNYEPDNQSGDDGSDGRDTNSSTGEVETEGGSGQTDADVTLVNVDTGERVETGGGQPGGGQGAGSGGGQGGGTGSEQSGGTDNGADSGGGANNDEANNIDAGVTTGQILPYYGCMDKAATNFGLDSSGKPLPQEALDDPDFWVIRAISADNSDDPCKYVVEEPEPEDTGKCTDEQLANGYTDKYGHINLQKGGTFEEYPTDLESVTITTGPNAGQSFELSWYCVPPEPKEQKVKVVENTKKETTKKTQVISSQSQSNKLYSTYKGTLNQNYSFLYKVTPWYAASGFTKNSFYGENGDELWVDGNHGTTTRPVSFWIRKKFWDEYIEEPNSTGVSQWGDSVSKLELALDDWINGRGLFQGYDMPTYNKGVIQDQTITDPLPPGKFFTGPNMRSRFPKNMGKSSGNELDLTRPIIFSKPVDYVIETVAGENQVKQVDGVFQTREKKVWR